MLSLSLFVDRRFWRLSAVQVLGTIIEAAICPAYLVNITHRLSWNYIRLDVDGAAYGLLRCSPDSLVNLKAAFHFALEELEQVSADEPNQRDRVIAYRKSLLR